MATPFGIYVNDRRVTGATASTEFMTVFRDETLESYTMSAEERWGAEASYPNGPETFYRYIERAEVLADRLEAMGYGRTWAMRALDEAILERREPERYRTHLNDFDFRHPKKYSASQWMAEFRQQMQRGGAGGRSLQWLVELVETVEDLALLSLVCNAMPDAQIRFEVTWFVERRSDGYLDALCARRRETLWRRSARHSPVVVLTEGKTDAEFLSAALGILLPHLLGLIRFMDYEPKPEGGASALTRMVRAFASAGVANRTIALFDNDVVGRQEVQRLQKDSTIPRSIRPMSYPDLNLARSYPTQGLPVVDGVPTSQLVDVNGLAAWIELYLGTDVLTGPDGTLMPVRWNSLMGGTGQCQGKLVDKHELHRRFRAKVEVAERDPSAVAGQDWAGLVSIFDDIRAAISEMSE